MQNALTDAQRAHVERVERFAIEHYENGGDVIVECMGPAEILAKFPTMESVQNFILAKLEQALNCREGNDTDPELVRYENFVAAMKR